MRYLVVLALFGLCGCDWFAPPPPPTNAPAILTETAALHALSTARAEAFPPTVAIPPATQTAVAVHSAVFGLLLTLSNAQNEATSTAIYATLTALPAP